MSEMYKKWTGAFLFCVMTMVVALEIPAFKYCLCSESFLLDDCACELVESESAEASSDLGCCSEANYTPSNACKNGGNKQNCTLILSLDLGDYYQGVGFDFSPTKAMDVAMNMPSICTIDSAYKKIIGHGHLLPPPASSLPIYVRNSVYLI